MELPGAAAGTAAVTGETADPPQLKRTSETSTINNEQLTLAIHDSKAECIALTMTASYAACEITKEWVIGRVEGDAKG